MLSLKREIEGMVLQDQTTAVKETTVNNRDSRSHNICVSSDKLGFFCVSMTFSFCESYALFGYKNLIVKYSNCPISTHPAEKITLARWLYEVVTSILI